MKAYKNQSMSERPGLNDGTWKGEHGKELDGSPGNDVWCRADCIYETCGVSLPLHGGRTHEGADENPVLELQIPCAYNLRPLTRLIWTLAD